MIVNVPTREQIKARTAPIKKTVGEHFSTSQHLRTMPKQEKKRLIQMFFAGKDPDGRRWGVYVKRGTEEGAFDYRIVGGFTPFAGTLGPAKLTVADFVDTGISLEFLEDIPVDDKKQNPHCLCNRHTPCLQIRGRFTGADGSRYYYFRGGLGFPGILPLQNSLAFHGTPAASGTAPGQSRQRGIPL